MVVFRLPIHVNRHPALIERRNYYPKKAGFHSSIWRRVFGHVCHIVIGYLVLDRWGQHVLAVFSERRHAGGHPAHYEVAAAQLDRFLVQSVRHRRHFFIARVSQPSKAPLPMPIGTPRSQAGIASQRHALHLANGEGVAFPVGRHAEQAAGGGCKYVLPTCRAPYSRRGVRPSGRFFHSTSRSSSLRRIDYTLSLIQSAMLIIDTITDMSRLLLRR